MHPGTNSHPRIPYGVKEAEGFTEQAMALFGSVQKWDEVKEFIDHYIERDPKMGLQIPGTRLYALPIEYDPLLTIYYMIDEALDQATGEV